MSDLYTGFWLGLALGAFGGSLGGMILMSVMFSP